MLLKIKLKSNPATTTYIVESYSANSEVFKMKNKDGSLTEFPISEVESFETIDENGTQNESLILG